jgi:hypothetical protein
MQRGAMNRRRTGFEPIWDICHAWAARHRMRPAELIVFALHAIRLDKLPAAFPASPYSRNVPVWAGEILGQIANDPCMVRHKNLLQFIRVRPSDFIPLVRKHFRRPRGTRPGSAIYLENDMKFCGRAHQLVQAGMSRWTAIRTVSDEGRLLAGENTTSVAKCKRVLLLYNRLFKSSETF